MADEGEAGRNDDGVGNDRPAPAAAASPSPEHPSGIAQQQQQQQPDEDEEEAKPSKPVRVGDYLLLSVLQRSKFGVVRLVLHVPTNTHCVIKQFNATERDSHQHAFNEARWLRAIKHRNVVALHKVISTRTKVFVVLEHATGGDLGDLMAQHSRGLLPSVVHLYFHQLVAAVSHVHACGVVHRDLKAENCLLTSNRQRLLLCDFGFACEADHRVEFNVTPQGTLPYAAPELLAKRVEDPFKIDVWSCGVLLYFLFTGSFPFAADSSEELYQQAMASPPPFPQAVCDSARQLLAQMLQPNAAERITMEGVCSHQFTRLGPSKKRRRISPPNGPASLQYPQPEAQAQAQPPAQPQAQAQQPPRLALVGGGGGGGDDSPPCKRLSPFP